MILARKAWVVALLLAPLCAAAHSPIKGVMPFYGGIAHPFVVPAHIIAMISLGLFMGQNAKEQFGQTMLSLLVALVTGLSLSGVLGDPDTDMPLLAASALLALAVSWARPQRTFVVVCAAAVTGLVMGLGSGPEGLAGSQRWITLAGTGVGTFVGISWVLIVAEHAKRPWQKIALRVVGSWIAASAVIVLSLIWVGPRKSAATVTGDDAHPRTVTCSPAQCPSRPG